jgi:hypothetical protein
MVLHHQNMLPRAYPSGGDRCSRGEHTLPGLESTRRRHAHEAPRHQQQRRLVSPAICSSSTDPSCISRRAAAACVISMAAALQARPATADPGQYTLSGFQRTCADADGSGNPGTSCPLNAKISIYLPRLPRKPSSLPLVMVFSPGFLVDPASYASYCLALAEVGVPAVVSPSVPHKKHTQEK